MRKAVTFLQSVARFRPNMLITATDVHEITGVCSCKLIERNDRRLLFLLISRSFRIMLLKIFIKYVIRVLMKN